VSAKDYPLIDISSLFGEASRAREAADEALLKAAETIGFMLVGGLPADVPMGRAVRAELLRFFTLQHAAKRALARNHSDPTRPLVMRGWFERGEDDPTYYEGMDVGPDIAHGDRAVVSGEPLRQATPLPSEDALPGWHKAARAYYLGMERVAASLLRALARGLGTAEDDWLTPFRSGVSTLRLLRYPRRVPSEGAEAETSELYVTHAGARRMLSGGAHTDFGFVTLLAQHGVGGLQARHSNGDFVDVPVIDDALTVNFGKLLERWTGGRIKATEHRVLSSGEERFSIPFFQEPSPDALIAPLPIPGVEPFEPFVYGDHVWAASPRLRRNFRRGVGSKCGRG
jgi:isopenicillin N synthase-like dioxygenase